MFQLYHNKEHFIITIEPMKIMGTKYIVKGEVSKYNENYFICEDRKQLQQFAKDLKQQWIDEFKLKLKMAEDVKIKNKYK